MKQIFENILKLIDRDFQIKNKKCNRKREKKFKRDIECINEELIYDEIGSSNFEFESLYKNENEFFKNIYIDEFKHQGKKSVDVLTLSKFTHEKRGRFYFIEVKRTLNCYRYEEIRDKLIDSIERLESIKFSHEEFKSYAFVVGEECDRSENNQATSFKLKKEIEDIEFLDMPLGKLHIIKPNGTIYKKLESF